MDSGGQVSEERLAQGINSDSAVDTQHGVMGESPKGFWVLLALNKLHTGGRSIYEGTVARRVVRRRRVENKRARLSRRINRGSS